MSYLERVIGRVKEKYPSSTLDQCESISELFNELNSRGWLDNRTVLLLLEETLSIVSELEESFNESKAGTQKTRVRST